MASSKDPEILRIPAFMRKRSIASRLRHPLILTALDRKKAGLPPEGLTKKKKPQRKEVPQKPKERAHFEQSDIYSYSEGTLKPPVLPLNSSVRHGALRFRSTLAPLPCFSRGLGTHKTQASLHQDERSYKAEESPKKIKKTRAQSTTRKNPLPEVFTAPIIDSDFSEPQIEESNFTYSEPKRARRKTNTEPKSEKTSKQKPPKTIGTITHYYDKIQVGVIKLTGELCVGDEIQYQTEDGAFQQVVESMEIDREPVFKAKRGDDIGMKMERKPRVGGAVYGVFS